MKIEPQRRGPLPIAPRPAALVRTGLESLDRIRDSSTPASFFNPGSFFCFSWRRSPGVVFL